MVLGSDPTLDVSGLGRSPGAPDCFRRTAPGAQAEAAMKQQQPVSPPAAVPAPAPEVTPRPAAPSPQPASPQPIQNPALERELAEARQQASAANDALAAERNR